MSDGSDQHTWIEQGDYFFNTQDYTNALTYYGKGLQHDPTNSELLSKIGKAYFSLERYPAAEAFYFEALNHSDTYYLVYQYCYENPQKTNITVLQQNLSQHQVIITVEGLEYIIDTIKKDQEHSFSPPTSHPYPQQWEYQLVNLIRDAGIPIPFELLDIAHHLKHATEKPSHTISPLSLKRLTGPRFEQFLAQFFQHQGYNVKRLQQSHDMGGDLLVQKNDETIVIQAKHRRHKPIGVKAIQEVYAAWGYYHTTHAMVITTSRFTSSAQKLADSLGVECWDGDRLVTELRTQQHLSVHT